MVKGKIDFTKLTTNKGKFKQTYSTAAKRNAWAAKMGKKKGLTPAQIQSQLSSFNSCIEHTLTHGAHALLLSFSHININK